MKEKTIKRMVLQAATFAKDLNSFLSYLDFIAYMTSEKKVMKVINSMGI